MHASMPQSKDPTPSSQRTGCRVDRVHTTEEDIPTQDKPGTGSMSALSPGKEVSQAQGPFLQG